MKQVALFSMYDHASNEYGPIMPAWFLPNLSYLNMLFIHDMTWHGQLMNKEHVQII